MAREDLTGQKFGMLTVIEYSHSNNKSHSYWNCLCECGKQKIIRRDYLLKNGNTISCGCKKERKKIYKGYSK